MKIKMVILGALISMLMVFAHAEDQGSTSTDSGSAPTTTDAGSSGGQ